MRRIFVGDIQGCSAQLATLLKAVGFAAGQDQLVPVGDLVNKGPDSPGVLEILMEIDAQPVLGNHDLYWLRKGEGDRRQRAWLGSQPLVRVYDDVIAVHAGLHPSWDEARLSALGADEADFAVNVRYCDASGAQPDRDWPPPGPPFRPWDDFYRGDKRVVFGHWARRGLVVRPHCVGLDTGCVYGGKLTAWVAEEDRFVAVDGWHR
ncbi:MAG: metallophosphatase [Planctomycetes bacterium]|nr:metallophosphatase [Planctomycetota bacterium]